ncbi:MAG TPA: signal peptidase II [Thermoanaerobaculia bacterium]|jgi:signal peptidase II
MRPRLRYLLISLAVLVLDQWTKWLVETRLEGHATVEVVPNLLNFIHVRNTGVAFGLFAAYGDATGTLVLTLAGLVALALVGYFFTTVARSDRLLLVALSLVLGGAVGNLVDRVMSGGVTDFIDFYFGSYHWHTFNVADSAITIGIALMLPSTFRKAPETAAGTRDAPASPAAP